MTKNDGNLFNVSWACGLCWGSLAVVGAMALIGWNEKRAVCRAKAIDEGRDLALEVGCGDVGQGSGGLIFFRCDLQRAGLQPDNLTVDTGFFDVAFAGACLKTTSRMVQCNESTDSSRRRVWSTLTQSEEYIYEKAWTEETGSSAFHNTGGAAAACGVTSPAPWDADVPATSTRYANSVKAGVWTISDGLESIPCDVPLEPPAASLKAGSSAWSDLKSTFKRGSGNSVGDYEVSFSGNDWSNPGVTVLGRNANGVVEDWTTDSDWLCSGDTFYEVRPGNHGVEQFFSDREAENTVLTWTLRLVGFLMFWLGFICCLGPPLVLVFSDYAKSSSSSTSSTSDTCCGLLISGCCDLLLNRLTCIVLGVACVPGSCCCLMIVAICWVSLRPAVGATCWGVVGCAVFFVACYLTQGRKSSGEAAPLSGRPQQAPPPKLAPPPPGFCTPMEAWKPPAGFSAPLEAQRPQSGLSTLTDAQGPQPEPMLTMQPRGHADARPFSSSSPALPPHLVMGVQPGVTIGRSE